MDGDGLMVEIALGMVVLILVGATASMWWVWFGRDMVARRAQEKHGLARKPKRTYTPATGMQPAQVQYVPPVRPAGSSITPPPSARTGYKAFPGGSSYVDDATNEFVFIDNYGVEIRRPAVEYQAEWEPVPEPDADLMDGMSVMGGQNEEDS